MSNRPSYVSFGLALLIGYGAFALAHGDDPILPMPSAVPAALLLGGLLTAVTITGVATAKARRAHDAVIGNMLAAAWFVGFGALFLVITALSEALQDQRVHTLLRPAGSGLVIGLIYLAGGIAHRDVLQYGLGVWLAVTSPAALFLQGANVYWALALAGGGAYLVAATLEPRRSSGTSSDRSTACRHAAELLVTGD